MPRLCAQLLPDIRTWAKERKSFPVMSWLDFVAKVREINSTADEEGVRNIAFYLNESVEVTEFFLQPLQFTKTNALEMYILICTFRKL